MIAQTLFFPDFDEAGSYIFILVKPETV